MKRILIDLKDLNGNTSGFSQIAINYAQLFSKIKWQGIKFVFLVRKEFMYQYGENVEYHCISKWQKFFPFLLPKVDVWHSMTQQNRLLRLSASTKRVLTIHDVNFMTEKSPVKAQRYLCRLQKNIDHSTVVVAISHFVAKEVKSIVSLKDKEIKVIYNGVERLDEAPSAKPDFIKSDRPFFFGIGQIRKKKNFHLLVPMMTQFADYDLYICGDDHFADAELVRREIAILPAENAFLTGPISQENKVWLYQHCAAYLFPSIGEGFGIPAIEAMQFGKPVFISNKSSLPEVCCGHAFIWEELDPENMAQLIKDKLSAFYNDKDAINQEKVFAYSFTYDRHIKQYLDIYQSLLVNKR